MIRQPSDAESTETILLDTDSTTEAVAFVVDLRGRLIHISVIGCRLVADPIVAITLDDRRRLAAAPFEVVQLLDADRATSLANAYQSSWVEPDEWGDPSGIPIEDLIPCSSCGLLAFWWSVDGRAHCQHGEADSTGVDPARADHARQP